jgi:hypothetical protein
MGLSMSQTFGVKAIFGSSHIEYERKEETVEDIESGRPSVVLSTVGPIFVYGGVDAVLREGAKEMDMDMANKA